MKLPSIVFENGATREREIVVSAPDGDRVVRRCDLCVAHLLLDEVVAWKVLPSMPGQGAPEFVATCTYVTTALAPWSAAPEFRQVFPMAALVLDGAWVSSGLAD